MISRALFFFVRITYIGIDLVSVFTAIFLACWLRKTSFPFNLEALFFDTSNPFYVVFLSWVVTVLFFNGLHKLYETRREIVERHEIGQVVKSVCLAAVTVLAFVYVLKVQDFPRSVFILIVFFTILFLSLWRVFKRWFVDMLVAHGYNNINIVIVGAGKVGMMLVSEIERHPGLGFRIVGFLDDNKTTKTLGGRYPVLGKLSDLEEVISRRFVSKVFFTIHPDGSVFHKMLETATDLKVAVRVVPQAFDKATAELFKYNIGYVPVLEYCEIGHNRQQFGKRAFDVVASFAGIVCLLPVFIMLGILIKMDSPGPVFYFSSRYGRGGRVLKMWKFRSMVAGADKQLDELKAKNEVDGPIFKIRQDPRITPLGKFLRKYSLDELPQIINVLLGDMSLVGPRPLPLDQVEHEDLKQLKRLEVRPGITGLWQVRGRSDLPFHQLIKWDTWYINNWSFMLDIEILFETIPVVVKGKGAY
ncbi:MAG: sugar transferase [Candidatus Omnitrophica bacterium]|nr:sugar transferase [Candidatus Omnitrophota bacterium]